MAGWKKDATTEGTHSLNVEASYSMTNIKVDGPPATEEKQNLLNIMFSHGYILKAGTSYSIFLGDNTAVVYFTDDVPAPTPDPDQTGFSVSPNLVFHKDLGHNFELSSGASATLSYNMFSNPLPAGTQEASRLLTSSAAIDLGLRWVKDNFAFEGSVNEAILAGGPNFISGSINPMFAQVGISLGF